MRRVPQAYLEARTDEIRAAVVRVFVREGLDRTTMHDSARETGLSAGAIYHYFDSKEALVRAVFERCGDESRSVFEQTFVTTGSPVAAIAEMGQVAWRTFSDPGALDRFALSASATIAAGRAEDGIGADFRRMHDGALATLVRRAQAAGEMDREVDVWRRGLHTHRLPRGSAPAVRRAQRGCRHGRGVRDAHSHARRARVPNDENNAVKGG